MATISITRAHGLDHEQAREAARTIAGDLARRFDLACRWRGDALDFKRAGLSGEMTVGERSISLKLTLGLLLSPMKGSIEEAIERELDRSFGAKLK